MSFSAVRLVLGPGLLPWAGWPHTRLPVVASRTPCFHHCTARPPSETQATLALQGGHSRSRVDVSLHTSYGVCTGVYPADELPFLSFETYALFSLPRLSSSMSITRWSRLLRLTTRWMQCHAFYYTTPVSDDDGVCDESIGTVSRVLKSAMRVEATEM